MVENSLEITNLGPRRNLKLLLAGTGVGIVYGAVIRLLASFPRTRDYVVVMSAGFILLMPFAMGFIAVYVAEIRQGQRKYIWALLPWLPVAGSLVAVMLLLLEGLICVVMLAPAAFLLATLGGLAGGATARNVRNGRARKFTMSCVMVLPLLSMLLEQPAAAPPEVRRVENVIDIQAPPEVIWKNIQRVPAIRRDELPNSWSRRIGIPDPVEATLSHEGVGGVRNASFTGGLAFIETVDVWEPQQRLGFTIAAQTDQIPATTLDEHVRVGGAYFDVLRGEYRLEPLSNGVTRLHLSSQHRVSTDFNWYAHLWTDAVMLDLQSRILVVVRQRCEKKTAF
jgi:hypothetical protein